MYIPRFLDIQSEVKKKSCFLFGPRQTGKTSLIHRNFADCSVYNLLDDVTFLKLSQSPQILKEELTEKDKIIVIDEIQKLPSLLNQVHFLIEEKGINFLLTGSSARKLRRGGVNLLGGRARSKSLHPFVYQELNKEFKLLKVLNFGLIPSIYFSDAPEQDLESYVSNYLTQEIAAEGLTRNIPAFSRFLEVAALCNGQLLNFTEIASDSQVPRTTVYEYFQILKDTLIAYELPAWKKSRKRKPVSTSKFYFFDIGVARFLQHQHKLSKRSPQFGDAFEAYIFHELKSFLDYAKQGSLYFWRSDSGFEVDFVISDQVAIEVKGKSVLSKSDFRGLRALQEEHKMKSYYLVSLVDKPRVVDGINVWPWDYFLKKLWSGKVV